MKKKKNATGLEQEQTPQEKVVKKKTAKAADPKAEELEAKQAEAVAEEELPEEERQRINKIKIAVVSLRENNKAVEAAYKKAVNYAKHASITDVTLEFCQPDELSVDAFQRAILSGVVKGCRGVITVGAYADRVAKKMLKDSIVGKYYPQIYALDSRVEE